MNYLFPAYTILIYLILYNLVGKTNFFAQLHVGIFSVFVLLFEFISSFRIKYEYDFFTLNIQCIFILIYCCLILIISGKANIITFNEFDKICRGTDDKVFYLSMGPYLLLKVYLMNNYGLYAFNVLASDKFVNIPSYYKYLDALLAYPAIGAFFVHVYNVINGKFTKYLTISSTLCLAFLFLYGVFPGGARRFISFLALYSLLVLFYKYKKRINFRQFLYMIIIAVTVFSSFEWYQSIRGNIFELENKSSVSAINSYSLLTQKSKIYDTLSENLTERTGPFSLLYDMTSKQIDTDIVSGGAVLWQSILNVIPSNIYADKKYENIDNVLSAIFGFASTDLSTTLVTIMQSEIHLFAYLITPIIFIILLKVSKKLINLSGNFLFIMSVIGFVFSIISQVETTLDTLLSSIREVLIIYFLCIIMDRMLGNLIPKIKHTEL